MKAASLRTIIAAVSRRIEPPRLNKSIQNKAVAGLTDASL
jgi:hypothetical protein